MRNFRRASIQSQILTLATFLVVLVSVVATATEPFIYGRHDRGFQNGLFAARAAMITEQFAEARSAQDEVIVLNKAAALGIEVEKLDQPPAGKQQIVSPSELVARLDAMLADNIFVAFHRFVMGQSHPDALAVRIDDKRALVFQLPIFPGYLWFAPAAASGFLKIVIPLVLLAYFSSRLITKPLRRFAAAAKRASAEGSLEKPFEPDGAAEIRSLAESLNVMSDRIQSMSEDRTRMLSGVGHDLRTPLTRLRMRAERSAEPELRRLMLADITTLNFMIDECLAYFKDPSVMATDRKVDISSLLQTIATDFADTGIDVRFTGPRRLAFVCKPQALTRAITNLVENASRHATQVEIDLQSRGDGGIRIRVSDNGPGLTDELKAKVLEPFFKADKSRQIGATGGSGLGLGLPIAKGIVTRGHNGELTLLDGKPSGLVVVIDLPAIQATQSDGLPPISSSH
ncbi:signal transduction histidine kinase [Rhizobium leguminosarum bv. trifolii WSM597]|uniref:histidine kinase n=1 Tax=Rhizobium leguminosarum bv. trifolii WSM597 TaxID=754764 RepID=I9NC05_RHILT|nr:ATP-binding protein [Rhizobium leguminosarum]EJB05434.1 signal transduction histidine kinase [Rhizobium leguminosarum bv. trifolii WSM597]